MSSYYNYYDEDKFNFEETLEQHKPPKGLEGEFLFAGIMFILVLIWNLRICWKNFCKKEQIVSSPDLEATYSNNYNHQILRSMPIATIISENLRHISPASHLSNPLAIRPPSTSTINIPNLLTIRPYPTLTPTAPDIEVFQQQILQPTAPRLIEDNTPKYDSPPNYDEAMAMMSQQNRELDSSLSTDTSYLINEISTNKYK